MRYIVEYNSFSVNEKRVLELIENLEINEGISDWFLKLKTFFQNINDAIQNLLLTLLEKGIKSLDVIKKFFSKIFDKIKSFKDKNPVLFRTILITLVLIVLAFILCSSAASPTKTPPESVINAAIGLLHDIQQKGESDIDNSLLMKAQAYLFELKSGKEIEVGEETIKVAQSALKVIQQNVQEYRLSNDKNPEDVNYLLGLIEKGSKMVGYSIKEYADKLTGSYSGSDISLKYK